MYNFQQINDKKIKLVFSMSVVKVEFFFIL